MNLLFIIYIVSSVATAKFLRESNVTTVMANVTISSTATLYTTSTNCTTDALCSYNGLCVNNHQCKCNDGYITFPLDSKYKCNYQQTSRLLGFLLELFIGPLSGAGYFAIGQTALGAGQLVYFWGNFIIECCLIFVIGILNDQDGVKDLNVSIYSIIKLFWALGIFIWWIIAVVQIGNATITDGNGAELSNWNH